jgi:hypothetical protein
MRLSMQTKSGTSSKREDMEAQRYHNIKIIQKNVALWQEMTLTCLLGGQVPVVSLEINSLLWYQLFWCTVGNQAFDPSPIHYPLVN